MTPPELRNAAPEVHDPQDDLPPFSEGLALGALAACACLLGAAAVFSLGVFLIR